MFPAPSTKAKNLILVLLATSTFLLCPIAARAQTASPSPTPSPESEELKKLREQNAILDEQKKAAESEKAIAEAKKATQAAQLPTTSATPLEGKTEVDAGVKIESQILTYKTMAGAADMIVGEIAKREPAISAVAIHNEKDVRALLSYMALLRQLKLMSDEYDKIFVEDEQQFLAEFKPPKGTHMINNAFSDKTTSLLGAAAGIGAVTTVAKSVLGGFIDLIALLRTDTTVKGMDVSIEESALVSEVFRAVRDKQSSGELGSAVRLYYPAAFPPAFNADTPSEFLGSIQLLSDDKTKAETLITSIEENEKAFSSTKGEIETLKKRQKQIPNEIADLDKELEGLQKVHWKWPSARLAERIEELGRSIGKLGAERKKNAAALVEDAAKLQALQKTIDDLYGELFPPVPSQPIETALNNAAQKMDEAEFILGRSFTSKEIATIFSTDSDDAEKKPFIKEAEQHMQHHLSPKEKEKLFPTLKDAEREALVTILKEEEDTHQKLSIDARIRILSSGQQVALLGDIDQEALRKQKKASVARLKSLDAQYDKMVGDLTKTDATTGTNPLTLYLQAENLRGALACDNLDAANPCPGSYLLQLKVLVAGGNVKTKKNLLTNVFTGANISHSGGSIVEYNLYDMNGASRASNTFTVYEKYRKAKDISKISEANP